MMEELEMPPAVTSLVGAPDRLCPGGGREEAGGWTDDTQVTEEGGSSTGQVNSREKDYTQDKTMAELGTEERQDGDHSASDDQQSQTEATLKWLEANYECADGVCLPRCVLYTHYLHLCKQCNFSPAGAATFGKLIRQRFPKITTRRLGTRGQSKYHYYGIGIKEGSVYYHSVYSGKGLTRFSGTKVKTEGSNRKYSLSSKTGTLLPDFPKASDLVLPARVQRDKVETFSIMYRTHCQRILDTVISANFEEVQSFLLHFWQGMPGHLQELLSEEVISNLVGLCDSILYKVVADVLIPTTIQDLPDSLCSDIKMFVRRLSIWLKHSLEDVPEIISKKKLEVARHFTQSVRRQIYFIQLAQTSRAVLQCTQTIDQMLTDLDLLEFDKLCLQMAALQGNSFQAASTTVRKCRSLKVLSNIFEPVYPECYSYLCQYTATRDVLAKSDFADFRCLLKKQATIESFIEWIDNMIDGSVIKKQTTRAESSIRDDHASQRKFQSEAATFLLQWSIFSSFLLRDLTLSNAGSFGSLHVLYMTFNEYVMLVMETQQAASRDARQKQHITTFIRNTDDLSMQAKHRPPVGRGSTSPRSKRRKEEANGPDPSSVASQDNDSLSRSDLPSSPVSSLPERDQSTCTQPQPHGGAFCRPQHLPKDTPDTGNYSDLSYRGQHQCVQPLPVSPLKPSPIGGVGGYSIPHLQVGFGTCPPDYPHLPAGPLPDSLPRFQHYASSEPHTPSQHGFPTIQLQSNVFNMAASPSCTVAMTTTYTPTSGASYWGDGGGRATSGGPGGVGENYHSGFGGYGTKYGTQYESFPRTPVPYTDPGGLYGRGPVPDAGLTAATITGGPFSMAAYSGNMNYLEPVVPPGVQYRQDMGNPHQEAHPDFYTGGFPASMTSLNKQFMAPFR